MILKPDLSHRIKAKAIELGFLSCGISKADFLSEEATGLERWLSKGYQGSMGYMNNHFDKRLDPRLLVEGAKSVISVTYNYFPEEIQNSEAPKLAKYAYGEDYHVVVKDKLRALMDWIHQEVGQVSGRAFVDSAPVMERAWAKRSGLGWIGKNSLLLSKGVGSFFFLGELILDLALTPDAEVAGFCGTCTKCIDACPTEAIIAPEVIDSNKCISHLTIELKSSIPQDFQGLMDNWVFGCDVCQDVCPWNRFSKPHTEDRFKPSHELIGLDWRGWTEMTEEVFKRLFKGSAVKRAKYVGLKRNIDFLNGD